MTHVFSDAQKEQITQLIRLAWVEDRVNEDATSRAIFKQGISIKATLTTREPLVFAGEKFVPIFLETIAARLHAEGVQIELHVKDGDMLSPGATIGTISGNTIDVLAHERTLLNFLQRMCGVATLTRKYVDAVKGTKAKILDTRKTIPGWRALDKYAVTCGSGVNHRMDLASEVMIKDNHIAAAGSLQKAIEAALPLKLPIIVECDTLEQVRAALEFPVTRLLLDNMPLNMLKQAVTLASGKIPLEASGGVNLQTVGAIAETGVDYISVGAITHSATAVDIGLDIHGE